MAFVLRRPFALTTTLKQLHKSPSTTSVTVRALHTPPKPTFTPSSKPTSPLSALNKARNAFHRTYMQPAQVVRPDTGNMASKLLYAGGVIGGTILATNLLFNRETREDGGMPPYERSYLNETFLHTGLGLGMIAVAAKGLHASGWSYRLMSMNPWVVVGGSLVLSIGSMVACRSTDPSKYVALFPLSISPPCPHPNFSHPVSQIQPKQSLTNAQRTATSPNTPSGQPSTSPKQASSPPSSSSNPPSSPAQVSTPSP